MGLIPGVDVPCRPEGGIIPRLSAGAMILKRGIQGRVASIEGIFSALVAANPQVMPILGPEFSLYPALYLAPLDIR